MYAQEVTRIRPIILCAKLPIQWHISGLLRRVRLLTLTCFKTSYHVVKLHPSNPKAPIQSMSAHCRSNSVRFIERLENCMEQSSGKTFLSRRVFWPNEPRIKSSVFSKSVFRCISKCISNR